MLSAISRIFAQSTTPEYAEKPPIIIFGLVFFGLFFQIGVVDMTASIDTVRNDVVQFTGEVNRRTVSQVTTMRQVHTQNGITWFSSAVYTAKLAWEPECGWTLA